MAALVLFWVGLLLGAATFVPGGALGDLFTRGRLGISLLMTISATGGAVILGYVEEAAALAFLYSIAEALEDKAMDRAVRVARAVAAGAADRDRTPGRAGPDDSGPELAVGDVLLVAVGGTRGH